MLSYGEIDIPAQDHRCLTAPRPPSTAAEAYALYACWESRLPDLRRSHALRLLEAVAAHDAFSSPPRTRFSEAVENHLFVAWPAAAAAEEGAATSSGGSSSGSSGGSGAGLQALPFLRGPELSPPGVGVVELVGSAGASGGGGGGGSGNQGSTGGAPNSAAAAVAAGRGASTGTPSGAPALASASASASGSASAPVPVPAAAVAGRTARGTDQGGRRRAEEEGVSGGPVLLDPDVYLGFYKNLVKAKGVPSGFKSSTTKSMDDGACLFRFRFSQDQDGYVEIDRHRHEESSAAGAGYHLLALARVSREVWDA